MKLKNTLILLSMLTATVASAQVPTVRFGQHANTPRSCASMEVLERQIQEDPTRGQRLEEVERHTQQFIANGGQLQTRAVITIPVVFHIVYRSATQNISDAQIQSQLDVLNKDFRKLNPDVSQVPATFAGLAADCELQFCMAQRTPAGVATNGINRVASTRTTTFGTNDAVKNASTGGTAPWDATKYLNIWVCEIGGGILGYAQFPGGSTATDGVVLDYRYTGTNGTATAPFHLGRTATHEVGHWLNLRHIWGDANCGNDQVSDTPTQQTSNGGCPTFPKVTCSNGPNGDMFMNYMDYTNDACMYMFSAGQKARMLAVLSTGGARASLTTSNGCTPPTPAACNLATNLSASGISTTGATVSWTAAAGATSYNLSYRASTASTFTTITGATSPRVLTGLTAGTTYQYYVTAVCAGGSASTGNSTFATTSVTTGCTDAFESNETLATAKTITLGATGIKGLINVNSDRDWFKFTNSSAARNIRVSLSGLPADYDVKLYNSAGTQVAVSQKGGTTAESIRYNTTVIGTYYIQVYPYGTAANATTCYTLSATTTSSSSRESGEITPEKSLVMPNPANTELFVQLQNVAPGGMTTISLINLAGQEAYRQEVMVDKGGADILQLNIANVPTGMYIVQIRDFEGYVETSKLTIMR